jgi:hypothetical protein
MSPDSMLTLTASEICKLCSLFSEQILACFTKVVMVDHPYELSQITKYNTLIQWYLGMLQRILSDAIRSNSSKVIVHKIVGINVERETCGHTVNIVRNSFKLETDLSLHSLSEVDPKILICILNIVINSGLNRLSNQLQSPRELTLVENCKERSKHMLFVLDRAVRILPPDPGIFPNNSANIRSVYVKVEIGTDE